VVEEDRADARVVEPLAHATRASVVFANGTEALRDVSIALAPRELVAIVGPSGCGKSTLLRLLAGLLRPTDGDVAAPRDGVGFVFQQPRLLAWRTVVANVALPLELAGTPAGERTARALATLARVGLGDVARAYPVELSGGMRMRAALARGLVTNPSVLLLDEPFASLDELTREQLAEELVALRGMQELAGCLVTHSVAEAVFLADRVLVMSPRPGRIVAEIAVPFGKGRPAELRADPLFARVAGDVSRTLRRTAA
jgi:NitT/TauT family transport system ATP-binding protein